VGGRKGKKRVAERRRGVVSAGADMSSWSRERGRGGDCFFSSCWRMKRGGFLAHASSGLKGFGRYSREEKREGSVSSLLHLEKEEKEGRPIKPGEAESIQMVSLFSPERGGRGGLIFRCSREAKGGKAR